jgi:ABC-2 type transport system permease protein
LPQRFVETLRDRRFFVSALIVGGLLFAALALGWQHSRQIERQHRFAQELTRKQWLNQETKAPHSAAHYGVYAFKPQMPLSFIDRGIESFTGVAVWLEAHKQNDFRYRPAQDQTALARFGELTAAVVLQILLPLLIILLAFTPLPESANRETLRQFCPWAFRRKISPSAKFWV